MDEERINYEFYLTLETYEKLCEITKDMGEEYEATALERIIEYTYIDMQDTKRREKDHEEGKI